jgi:hypothetical protein
MAEKVEEELTERAPFSDITLERLAVEQCSLTSQRKDALHLIVI